MTVSLVVPEHLATELLEAATAEVETAGVLLARLVLTPAGHIRLLARVIHWVPDDAYLVREVEALSISSNGYVPALGAAEADRSVPIWLHTHPGEGSSPRPSRHDEIVDQELTELFRLRSGSPLYGAVIIAHEGRHLRLTGHIESDEERTDIDRLWVTGRRFGLTANWLHRATPLPDYFDRNIRAFGGEVQQILGDLRVAIVGCGGTGSAVAEQLVRLGVRHFDLFDPDTLTASNITRVYGSFPDDIGRAKINIVAAHIQRIAPDADVATHQSKITLEGTARHLLEADIVFGCTDDNAGRLVLSRVASYFLMPVIDCGVLLSSGLSGQLDGIDGRVTVLAPGTACLVCRNRIDLRRASAEMLAPDEHRRLADEGYAPALPGVEPAVVAYTTKVAAAAVGELLERLIHYGPEPAPTEVLLRMHEREISTNDQAPRNRHYCHPASGKLGLGITEPFLEQTWQA
ncbi:MAG: ThiF family adenylyltransferase [Gammaproteobacteria bacterium]|nr:ThiF family adenylyltransferase [Gammaproteobacteria bacterium]